MSLLYLHRSVLNRLVFWIFTKHLKSKQVLCKAYIVHILRILYIKPSIKHAIEFELRSLADIPVGVIN